jgi:REP-associated tyrosine transposase
MLPPKPYLQLSVGGVGCLTLSSTLLYNVCMNTKIAYKSNRNVYYSCKYHVVWCPKYRRKVLVERVSQRLEQIIHEVCQEHEAEVLSLDVQPDHVHLFVECDPQFGIHRLVRLIKGRSSRALRQEFPRLETRMPTLWTNSYFVSTVGGAPLSVIKQYIENQRHV